jgi:hypothetical protein
MGVPSAAAVEHIEAEAWAELQLSLPKSFRNRFGIRVERIAGGVLLLADKSPVVAINRVVGLGVASPLTESQLDAVIGTYTAAGIERFIIQLSPAAEPANAPNWLEERGFRVMSHLAKVYRPTDVPVARSASDSRLRVVEVDARQAETYERIVAAPLGVPDGLGRGIRSTIGRPGWRFYLVYDEERPIAGAASYRRGSIAWCGLGATIESDRRRGAQSMLLARRIENAAADGCSWVSAEALANSADHTNQSYRNMCRAGFATLYERPNYLFDPTGSRQNERAD